MCDPIASTCITATCDAIEGKGCGADSVCLNTVDADSRLSTQCVPRSQLPQPAGCVFTPEQLALPVGGTHTLAASAFLSDGTRAPHAQVVFSSSQPTTLEVDAAGRVRALQPGDAVVTASTGAGVTCSAAVKVLEAVPSCQLRAVLRDAHTGGPLAGETIGLTTASATLYATTNAEGAAHFEGLSSLSDVVDVTAFPAGHAWQTFVRPQAADVLFSVERALQPDKVAGAAGTMDLTAPEIPVADIKIGFAALAERDVTRMRSFPTGGRTEAVHLQIPAIGLNGDASVDSGAYMSLLSSEVKGSVDVEAGGASCPQGSPCRRALWALGGQVSLSRLAPILLERRIDSNVLRHLNRSLYYDAITGLALHDVDRPANGAPVFSTGFVLRPSWPRNVTTVWSVPQLPTVPTGGEPLTQVGIFAAAYLPDQGVVPLGMALGHDECVSDASTTCVLSPLMDGIISCANDAASVLDRCAPLQAGDMVVRRSTPHNGLEGARGMGVVVAEGSSGASSYRAILVGDLDDGSGHGRLRTGFLPFSQASFSNRQVHMDAHSPGVHLFRVHLADAEGRVWDVLFEPPASNTVVALPVLPPGVTQDRVASAELHAFAFQGGTNAPGLTAVATFGALGPQRINQVMEAFTTQALAAP